MENKKKLILNSFYNVLYKVFSLIFPLISSVYIARVLTPTNVGKVSAAQNIVSYFLILSSMGIPTYGVKLIAQFVVKSKESSKAFLELWGINFALSIISGIAYYSLILLFPFFHPEIKLYCICGFSLLLNIFNVDWFYQGIQEYKYIAIRSMVVKVVSFASLFIFVKTKEDYVVYALLLIVANGGNYLFNIIKLKEYIVVELSNLHFRNHLKHIVVLFGAALAAEVYTLTDTTMLNIMCDDSVVGYYYMSCNIIRVLRGLVVAVAAVFLPQLSFYYHNGEKDVFLKLTNKGIHLLLFLTVPIACGLIVIGSDITRVFLGIQYDRSILSTQILSISIISIALSNFIGLQILVTIEKEKFTMLSTVIGAVINVTINILLIPQIGHIGAAIASVLTEASVTCFQYYLCKKNIGLKIEMKNILISVIAMIIVVAGIHLLNINPFIRLIIEVLIGVLTYFSLMYCLKDEFMMDIKYWIKNRIMNKSNTL